MTDDEIQRAVNTLLADMVERGLKSPHISADFRGEDTPQVYLRWKEDGFTNDRYEFGSGDDMIEALHNAKEILEAIPPKAEREKAEFTRLLANVIDKGRSIGIEVDYLNPLTETMKRLSENALTYQPAARPEHDLPF